MNLEGAGEREKEREGVIILYNNNSKYNKRKLCVTRPVPIGGV